MRRNINLLAKVYHTLKSNMEATVIGTPRKNIPSIFKIVCIVATICMLASCTYDFVQNKDSSEISIVAFNDDEDSIYPQTSLCFTDILLDDELKKIGDGVNARSYAMFLNGAIWDDRMKGLDIEKVTRRLEDYVLGTCVQSHYGSHCDGKGRLSTMISLYGAKCLLFQYTYPKRVTRAHMWIKSSIFANGIRPIHSYEFVFNPVFPQQVNRITSAITKWPPRVNASDTYVVKIYVSQIEVIRRRRKRGNDCYNWKKYDSIVQDKILSEVGCRPFNSTSMMKLPVCSTKEQMKQVRGKFFETLANNGVPPCSEIQSLQTKVDEYDTDSGEQKYYPDLQTNLSETDGWFRVFVEFKENTFKAIKQNRAYTVQSLIGNAGGYVGLFVGYTVAELPILLGIVYKWFTSILSGQHNSKVCSSSPVDEIHANVQRKAKNRNGPQNIFQKYTELEARLEGLEHEMRTKLDKLEG